MLYLICYSHVFGSGLCIFCRWPLQSFMALPFSLNGYPHYIHQGDWPAGKSMGYASTITPGGFKLNLYIAHVGVIFINSTFGSFTDGLYTGVSNGSVSWLVNQKGVVRSTDVMTLSAKCAVSERCVWGNHLRWETGWQILQKMASFNSVTFFI